MTDKMLEEQIERLATVVVYPRFLGVDDHGDNVWELADGRWIFGDEPRLVAGKTRTFEPERYAEKYGTPCLPRDRRTGQVFAGYGEKVVQKTGAQEALGAMLSTLKDWIEGAKENHEALDHQGEIVPCWNLFHPDDIRRMINDAARQVGVPEPWKPQS